MAIRLSNIRCSLKRAAASEVKGFYQLIPGEACKARVKNLIATTEYIYPRKYSSPFADKVSFSSVFDCHMVSYR
jgi:hypothetical protein